MSDVQGGYILFFCFSFSFIAFMDISPASRNKASVITCSTLFPPRTFPDIPVKLIYVIFDLQLYFFHFLLLLMYVDSFQSHNNIALP